MLTFLLAYGLDNDYPGQATIARSDFGPLAWGTPLAAMILLTLGSARWTAGLRR